MLRKCFEWAFSHRSKKGSIKLVAAVFRSINTLYTFMYSLIDGHKMLNGFAASKVRKHYEWALDPYSGNLTREKTFMNWWKMRFYTRTLSCYIGST